MSYSPYLGSHGEDWEDLIDWTGQYYDPIFEGNGSPTSEQQHASAPSLSSSSGDGMQGRPPRGRKKGLTAEGRRHAALMRIVGACTNCQRGKRKCNSGTPCKPCLEHYKGDLIKHPCRNLLLTKLSDTFLSDRLGWHPTARSPESIAAPNRFDIATDMEYTIPVILGFGPPLTVPVYAVQLEDKRPLVHMHAIHSILMATRAIIVDITHARRTTRGVIHRRISRSTAGHGYTPRHASHTLLSRISPLPLPHTDTPGHIQSQHPSQTAPQHRVSSAHNSVP